MLAAVQAQAGQTTDIAKVVRATRAEVTAALRVLAAEQKVVSRRVRTLRVRSGVSVWAKDIESLDAACAVVADTKVPSAFMRYPRKPPVAIDAAPGGGL